MKLEKHIFICTNDRKDNPSKKSCSNKGIEIRKRFVEELKNNNIDIKVRANKSGCLGLCNIGPVIVIYPQAIWYKNVSVEDVPLIVNETIIKNKIIEKFLYI